MSEKTLPFVDAFDTTEQEEFTGRRPAVEAPLEVVAKAETTVRTVVVNTLNTLVTFEMEEAQKDFVQRATI